MNLDSSMTKHCFVILPCGYLG